jgi:hypothetical protein
MATFLDLTLIEGFSRVFIFFIVWVIAYGALETVEIFGEQSSLNALLAFATALLSVFSTRAVTFIEFVVPWFSVLAVGMFFFLLALMATGHDMDAIKETANKPLYGTALFLAVLIGIFGLSAALNAPDQVSPPPVQDGVNATGYEGNALGGANQNVPPVPQQEEETFADTLVYTFTHPKVLGTMFLLVMGALTIATLASPMRE